MISIQLIIFIKILRESKVQPIEFFVKRRCMIDIKRTCLVVDFIVPPKYRVNLSKVRKVGDFVRGWHEGSLFNSYYTEVKRTALLHSLDFSTLPLIRTL